MKKEVFAYLKDRGFKDFNIKKSGSFIKVQLWDIVTFEQVEILRNGLNDICGKVDDPKYSWLDVCEFRCGNVRFTQIRPGVPMA